MLPHELFGLNEEEASRCLCTIARFIVEMKEDPEKIINLLDDTCRLFGAYMIGYYIGLNTQLGYPATISSVREMMRELREDRNEKAIMFVKNTKLHERFNLEFEEVLSAMKRIAEMSKVYPLAVVRKFDVKYHSFVSYFLGYLDGLADCFFNPFRVQVEMEILSWVYKNCSEGKEYKVKRYLMEKKERIQRVKVA